MGARSGSVAVGRAPHRLHAGRLHSGETPPGRCTVGGVGGTGSGPRARPGDDQWELFTPPVSGSGSGAGRRHAQAVDRSVSAAFAAGMLAPTDEAIVTMLRLLAWSADEAEYKHALYAPAKLAGPALDVLRELGMTPASRAAASSAASDDLSELFAALAAPTVAAADE